MCPPEIDADVVHSDGACERITLFSTQHVLVGGKVASEARPPTGRESRGPSVMLGDETTAVHAFPRAKALDRGYIGVQSECGFESVRSGHHSAGRNRKSRSRSGPEQ